LPEEGRPGVPLSGLRVIDLARSLAGPFHSMLLGEVVSSVLRIDKPAAGDRVHRPVVIRGGMAGLALIGLCACAAASDGRLTLANVTPSTARIDARLATVTVEPASRDRAVYPLPRTLTQLLPIWQAALQDALARKGIFDPGSPRQLSLVVKVLEFSLSGNILSVLARYQLFDVPPGNPVFSADIMSNVGFNSLATGVTSLDDPALATQNRTEIIRAIQDNITQFLDQLERFARGPSGGMPPRL
jgi:hypothetical protein